MSNQDQATRLIEHCIKRGYAPDKIATLMDKFDLLAPDPPQLFFQHGHCPHWEIPINDEDGGVATVRALGRDVFIERPGHGHGHGFITNPTEAKQLAAALLAAANYSEEA